MTISIRDDVNPASSTSTSPTTGDGGGLSIPREFWSAPVSETAWRGVRPRLSRLLLLLAPLIALVGAYVSAAVASHGHLIAAGWLLALAVCSILAGAVALGVHAHRLVRHRAEAPPGECYGRLDSNTGEVSK